MTIPGPEPLGRSLVVAPGGPILDAWMDAPRVTVGPDELADPGPVVEVLHAVWLERRPVVVELAAESDALRQPERHLGPVFELAPGFTFMRERLHFLIWANAYDARDGGPVWWHGRRAARRLDGVTSGGPADIIDEEGHPWWVDGGPRTPLKLAMARLWCTAGAPRQVSSPPLFVWNPMPSWRPTSWPPSVTRQGRFGSSPLPARARPGS